MINKRTLSYPKRNLLPILLSLSAFVGFGCTTPKIAPEPHAPTRINWVELGPSQALIARSLSSEASECPAIHFEDQKGMRNERMLVRTTPSVEFSTAVCEFQLPGGTKQAWIQTEALKLPKSKFDRIFVIGDTGCRLKGIHVQACNDPQKWPFPKIADEVAAQDPDLVIHTGDYYYRESACPQGKQGCTGSPHGDNWDSWKADFFTPARNLLKASPWIFVRGNHEDCNRGGHGWFRFLDPNPYPKECLKYTEPYQIKSDPHFIVFDSALADEFSLSDTLREKYTQQASLMKPMKLENAWLLSHRPPAMNPVLVQAFENQLPPGVNVHISGHLHFFEALNQKDGPSQIIVGNSGSALNELSLMKTILQLYRETLSDVAGSSAFGYMEATREQTRWKLTAYGLGRTVLQECSLNGSHIECKKK